MLRIPEAQMKKRYSNKKKRCTPPCFGRLRSKVLDHVVPKLVIWIELNDIKSYERTHLLSPLPAFADLPFIIGGIEIIMVHRVLYPV